jgi:hypothetical protein
MKTAVEWLIEELEQSILMTSSVKTTIKQAKEIEKQQIRDAFNAGDLDSDTYFIPFLKENDESENYYNETFKSE